MSEFEKRSMESLSVREKAQLYEYTERPSYGILQVDAWEKWLNQLSAYRIVKKIQINL